MSKIAIIGGGIVGATCAYYLSKSEHNITLFDWGKGQATKAAAGIISPWLSQRRNKIWYELVSTGAAFYEKLLRDLSDDSVPIDFYKQNGTFVFKKNDDLLNKLEILANERLKSAPQIGHILRRTKDQIAKIVPESTPQQDSIFVSGGALIDGSTYLHRLLSQFKRQNGTIIHKKVQLHQLTDYDEIIICAGAWLPELLNPLDYHVDVKPQKGQLFETQLSNPNSTHYPVFMPQSEIDLLPFENGKWVIGATHENDMGFDLQIDMQLIEKMKLEAQLWLPELNTSDIINIRVGTRSFTSDYTPFFGQLSQESIYVASGLGSSGLTSGPLIGYLLAQMVLNQSISFPIENYSPNRYIQKKRS